MGIINLAGECGDLNEITSHRPLASVPFGGRYRLIDFVLSSMVNSGIENIGVLTSHPHRSLVDHLRFGGDWRLSSKKDGLVLLPPSYFDSAEKLNGDVHSFRGNMDFFAKSSQEYVVVAGSSVIGSINYRDAFKFHEETSSDITFLYKKEDKKMQDCLNCTIAELTEQNRIKSIKLKPATCDNDNFLLDTFILRKKLLSDLVENSASHGGAMNLIGAIAANLDALRVSAFHYPGYLARIHCVRSYYRHSLSLLNTDIWRQLFMQAGQIYTKVRDEAPARYTDKAVVNNVLVAGGCQIGGQVENSVLFRRVKIAAGAKVNGCVLMSNTEVAENAVLENVICDKDVKIGPGKCFCGKADNPLVIKKGTVL